MRLRTTNSIMNVGADKTVAYSRLRDVNSSEKLAIAADMLSGVGAAFRPEIVDQILTELVRAPSNEEEGKLLAWAESLASTASTEYLCARLADISEDHRSAVAHWERLLGLTPERDALVLLAYASALCAVDRFDEAASILRRALLPVPRYAFFTRSGKLIREVGDHADTSLRKARIALLSPSTTNLLVPVLRALCFRDRLQPEFYEGLHGSIDQEILDPESGLSRFRPNLVFLMAHWRSLQLPAVADDEPRQVREILEAYVGRWRRLHENFGCHVVQQNLDFPAHESYGYLASSLPGGRARVTRLVNLELQEKAGSRVSILDTPLIQREVGLSKWEDELQWNHFLQHPATEGLPALADAMLAHARAVLGLTRKVLVTDLDNTLWKGVIGEDGLSGIKIGPGSPEGEAHARLQQYLLELKTRGILLAVASKNNPGDALLPFQKHPHMLLRVEAFAAFEANWNDKASNIREIARKLSLGLDAFVFLDDNPIEREWVRSQLPEMAIVEPGPSVFHFVRNLDLGRYFFSVSLSHEDRMRAEQYRSEAARRHLQTASQSLDEFLMQLQLRARRTDVDASNLARVAQLTNKTNQFNLTTRRYTETQIQSLLDDPKSWASGFQLTDRMGEYGLIGVIFCRLRSRDQWEVDTWLMSCRALGRQVETFMFDRLIEAAQARKIKEILGVYRPTPKNALVKDHYDRLGFEKISETPEEIRYRLAVPEHCANRAAHIINDSRTLSATT
jgi:FkbH-like protein